MWINQRVINYRLACFISSYRDLTSALINTDKSTIAKIHNMVSLISLYPFCAFFKIPLSLKSDYRWKTAHALNF